MGKTQDVKLDSMNDRMDKKNDMIDSMNDMIDSMNHKTNSKNDTMDSINNEIGLCDMAIRAELKLSDRLIAMFLSVTVCPDGRLSNYEEHRRLTAEEAAPSSLPDDKISFSPSGSRVFPDSSLTNRVSAVQRLLQNPKYRILVVRSPLVLVMLLHFHPTDANPGSPVYLTNGLIWFFPCIKV